MANHGRTIWRNVWPALRAILIFLPFVFSFTFAQTGDFDCILPGSTAEANPNTLRSVAFGIDRFVAVGDLGTIMLSIDAISWTRQSVPTEAALFDICYGAGQFVAVGNYGCVLTSTDGVRWDLVSFGTSNNFRKIAFGNSSFVTTTDNPKVVLRSSDARNWEVVATNEIGVWYVYQIFFGDGVFVAATSVGVLSSIDGRNWSKTSDPLEFKGSGVYGNGVYLVSLNGDFGAPTLGRSTNLTDWTTRYLGPIDALAYGGGKFLLHNSPGCTLRVSEDGQSWSNPISFCGYMGFAYGLGQFVAVGEGGAIATATDPTQWTSRNPVLCPIFTTTSGNNITVGIGGGIYTSLDNIHFTRKTDVGYLSSVVYVNSIFVVAGSGVFWSRDGIDWNLVATPCDGQTIWSLQSHDQTLVAVCQKIITSNDGTNWLVRVDGPGYLQGLFFGGDRWVAYGWKGIIWTSIDSTNWTNVSYATQADFGGGTFANGLYSLYGELSYRLPESAVVSSDGVHWRDPAKDGPLLSARLSKETNGTVLSLAGNWRVVYKLESTSNLVDWSTFGAITNVVGVATITVTNSMTSPLFIRASASQ